MEREVPMKYKLEESEHGTYEKLISDGKKYNINQCVHAVSPEGIDIGYTEFPTLEACEQAWGIRLIEKPKAERGYRMPPPPAPATTTGSTTGKFGSTTVII